jgi:thiamine pyrophosphate-dependent acetolactate synthase large subunit-like protein
MLKKSPVRFAVAALFAGSAVVAVVLPGAIAGAVVKPPTQVTCTALIGDSSFQAESGCAESSGTKYKGTAIAIVSVNSNQTAATVYWSNGKDATLSLPTATDVTNTCGDYLGVPATLEAQEQPTVTGGTAGLSLGLGGVSDTCVYIAGGDIATVGLGNSTL